MRDCGPVVATAQGSVGADWMNEIHGVRAVRDRGGRGALEIRCNVAGAIYTVVAEYMPENAVPPTGFVDTIAARWALTNTVLKSLLAG